MGLQIELRINGQSGQTRRRQKEELARFGDVTAVLEHKTTTLSGHATPQASDTSSATRSMREKTEELLREHGKTRKANPIMKALGAIGFNGFLGLVPIVDRTALKTTIAKGDVETTVTLWLDTAKDPSAEERVSIKSYEEGTYTLNVYQNDAGHFQQGMRAGVDSLFGYPSPTYTDREAQAYTKLIDLVEGCYSEVRPPAMENVICYNNQPVSYRELPHPYAG